MFGQSLVARMMLPLAVMTAVVIGTVWSEQRARHGSDAAQAEGEAQVERTVALTELRATSRALQRDALNLGTEPDPAALAEIGDRFNRRYRDFANELHALEVAEQGSNKAYFQTQREVLRQLAIVREAARIDRNRGLRLFREAVRPAERRGSIIADALIKDDMARIDALHRKVRALELQSDLRVLQISVLMSLVALAVALLVIFRTVLRPLHDIRTAMEKLAAGDAALTVPHAGRADAIGAMARSIEIFREAARERDTLLRDGARTQAAIAAQEL